MKHVLKLLVLAPLTIAVCSFPAGANRHGLSQVLAAAAITSPPESPAINDVVAPAAAASVAPPTALPLQPIGRIDSGPPPSTPSTATAVTIDSHQAYLDAMYLSVVPAGERAALDGRYVFGYNLPGLSCGTGCTNLFGGQARSSFDATFFGESLPYQRNTLAHEAAHAYGFLYFANYATPSWTAFGGWRAQFRAAAQGFIRTYDAEAWAACVAWKESGFNDPIDQIRGICTDAAATIAMANIA